MKELELFLRLCQESLSLEEYASMAGDEGGEKLFEILNELAEIVEDK